MFLGLVSFFLLLVSSQNHRGLKQLTHPLANNIIDQASDIIYRGGKVLSGPVELYLIFYGNWPQAETSLVELFLKNYEDIPWFPVLTEYTDRFGHSVTGPIQLKHIEHDEYSLGNSLKSEDILAIIAQMIKQGSLPSRENGIYLVLTSDDVQESQFCLNYCGWHTFNEVDGIKMLHGFVGNPRQCPQKCSAPILRGRPGPSLDAPFHSVIDTLAHLIAEILTDPFLDAWNGDEFIEAGDQCSYQYGPTQALSNKSFYNAVFAGRPWLIQQIWSPRVKQCVSSFKQT